MIILNTYRTLMTRGLKGCYVWAVDEGVREWLRGRDRSETLDGRDHDAAS
jgi:DUF2075 family protein